MNYLLQLPAMLNECEKSTGEIPLDLALIARQNSIAETLLKHGADVNTVDDEGMSLLHRAVSRGKYHL